MPSKLTSSRERQGSTLVVVMVIATALAVIVAALLSTMNTDARVNRGVALLDSARNASEGALELAVGEINRRAQGLAIPDEPLKDWTIPEAYKTALAVGSVVPSSIEFKCGKLSAYPKDRVLIDPDDPIYRYDAQKSLSVRLQEAKVYGKASAQDPQTGRIIERYTATVIQARTQSWLDYGIFSNLDLEFHAGPRMDVVGPLHSNSNIYLQGSGGLYFHDIVTTSKRVIRKTKGGSDNTNDTVRFAKQVPSKTDLAMKPIPTGQLVSMSNAEDSRRAGFYDYSKSRWKGFVQDESWGVREFQPPGLPWPSYTEDNYTTTAVDETRNHAYALIEPQLAVVANDAPLSGAYKGHKGVEVENLKASAFAGLTIRLKPPAQTAGAYPHGGTPYTASEFWNRTRLDNDDPNFEPGFELVSIRPSIATKPLNRENLPSRAADGRPWEDIIPTSSDRMSPALRNLLFAAIKLVEYREVAGDPGNKALIKTSFAAETGVEADLGTTTNRDWYPIYDRRQGYRYNASKNLGLFGAHHVLHIDMDAFNRFINADQALWKDEAAPSDDLFVMDNRYTGVVYVQCPLAPYSGAVEARATTDKIRPAQAATQTAPGFAVILRNAKKLPRLPVDASKRTEGFVLATNGPAYILGHYNADGNPATGSSTEGDTSDELPAVLAADSVTILSNAYATNPAYFELSATTKSVADYVEVSTAIFAGVVPTRLTNTGLMESTEQRMGGLHNYLRLLENWDSDGKKSYTYRGSIALLWENEVHLEPYYEKKHSYWYSPPNRDVGYHIFFKEGKNPLWPPLIRGVARLSVWEISKAEWDNGPDYVAP